MTTGLNIILKSLDLKPSNCISYLSLTYGSTKKIIMELCNHTFCRSHVIQIPLPIKSGDVIFLSIYSNLLLYYKNSLIFVQNLLFIEEDMLSIIQIELERVRPIAIVIDQITSNTALILPLKSIYAICSRLNIVTIVDAAHALNTTSINIYRKKDIDDQEIPISEVADVWISNCHKWLCSPKGCAFMWVNPSGRLNPSHVRPLIISHGHSDSPDRLLSSLAWDGCRDYAALLTIPSSLRLWQLLPEHNIYNSHLLTCAITLLANKWGLDESDFPSPIHMRASTMALVPLPRRLAMYGDTDLRILATDRHAYNLQETLYHSYAIEVPIKALEGGLYVRLSVHIYNTIEEYARLGDVVLKLL